LSALQLIKKRQGHFGLYLKPNARQQEYSIRSRATERSGAQQTQADGGQENPSRYAAIAFVVVARQKNRGFCWVFVDGA